ncbi:aldo/keto reductase [Microbacterium sp. Leaf151]|nr:aldo/keto reductase [Microbacterium sp. Leaf151]MCI9857032.1 aldo/keto reductase [Microbacterium proteolyticum]
MTAPMSRLGFGGAPVGNLYRAVTDQQAHDALEQAWAAGIRYFDTAPHYGLGLSERRLGAFLKEKPRHEFVISTKVGRLLEPNPSFAGGTDLDNGFDVPDDLVRRFDPTISGVRQSLEASLERTGLDSFDILFLHDPDVYDLEAGLSSGLPALDTLRDEGLVRQIGVGVNDAATATRAVREASLDLVMIAGRYTLLDQEAERELFPACTSQGTRVVAAAPYNSGLLATATPQAGATYDYGAVPDSIRERVSDIAEICAAHGVELPVAALQFPLRHPLVASVVVGSARAEAIAENAARLEAPVPDQLWVDIEAYREATR